MNTVFGILTVAAGAMAMAFILQKKWSGPRHVRLANIAEGTWKCSVSKLSDAAITVRHLLYKFGSDADHVAVAGVNDFALGTIADEVATADIGDTYLAVELLGRGPTKRMVASAAIAAGDDVYQGAAGKVSPTGFRYVGRALTAAGADNDVLTVDDQAPARNGGVNSIIATAVAAAGLAAGDAAALGNAAVLRVSSDGATKGVKLPAGVAGMRIEILNTTATACEIYPATGGTLNGAAANAPMTIPASTGVICFCTAADTWTLHVMGALAA